MSIHWAWPQITYAIITSFCLLCTAALHGSDRTGKHNFAFSICLFALWQVMLFYGGFWTEVRP